MENNYSTQQLDILTDVMAKQKEQFDKAIATGSLSDINDQAKQICKTSKEITAAVEALVKELGPEKELSALTGIVNQIKGLS